MFSSLLSKTISSKKYKQAKYKIYELFPVTYLTTKDLKQDRVSEWFGRFYVPFHIATHEGLMEELKDMLDPANCEGSEFILNPKRKTMYKGTEYIDVLFFYTWG